VGPGNHVLDGGLDPPWEGAILSGEGRPIVKYRDTAVIYAKMAEPIEMPFGFTTRVGQENGGPDTPSKWAVFGEEEPIVSIGTFCSELCKNG